MAEHQHVRRNFGPVYNKDSRVLILGSFPSGRSREQSFFYGHPQNRFWPLLARVCSQDVPSNIQEKTALLLENNIALWDVLEECDILGSSDSSIRNAVPVDIMKLLDAADIQQIYCNGAAAHKLFVKYLEPLCARSAVKLPSTSPANAAWSMDRLYAEWKQILDRSR